MKINVGVIFGGESVEHEVSIISAIQAMKALDESRYEVVPLYISKKRQLFSSQLLKEIEIFRDLSKLEETVKQVYLYNTGSQIVMEPIKKSWFQKTRPIRIDVIVPVIHGTNGEDGTVQGYLEMLKIPYSGCDVVAAGVGQDKVVMKYILEGSGLPICDWTWFYGHEFDERKTEIMKRIHQIGYPIIIKPACLGSSIGIHLAHNDDELARGVAEALRYDRKIVVEKIIENLVEINCSVLGDCYACNASSLEQVMKQEDILSFRDKYEGNKGKTGTSKGMASTSRIVPAPISKEKTEEIKDLAVKTFKALGASGVCRIDFLVDELSQKVYVNEINTIPGSLAFYLWQDSGVDFSTLMDRLIKQAVDRQRRREKMIFSYDSNILAGYQSGVKGSKAKG